MQSLKDFLKTAYKKDEQQKICRVFRTFVDDLP